MAESISIGAPAIEIRLRRNPRARRMVLRMPQDGGGPVLTLPPSVPLTRATTFLRSQEDWLRRNLAAQPPRIAVTGGTALPFRGTTVILRRIAQGRSAIRGETLEIAGTHAQLGPRAGAWLREAARDRLAAAALHHAGRLGRPVNRITLRDPRGRWGSCSSAGHLMFSWRLILAPDAVLDYVAAHEVAHLAEMNHAPQFWAVVARLCPGYGAPRDWLRHNGARLRAFDFTPA